MKFEKILISIIVPVYNVEKYLDACMKSILNQTYKNLEIILVDDGATDQSGNMCDYFQEKDCRVKVIHKNNGGLSDARNEGIAVADGDYLVFADSDDIVCPNLVDYLYNLIVETKADIGICDPVHCYPNKGIRFEAEKNRKVYYSEDAIVEMLYQKSFLVAAWGKIYKRKYFDNVKFPKGMLFEDSAVMYRLLDQATKIVYGDARYYGYMHREGSITTKKFSKQDCDILDICNEITEYMSNRSEKLQKAARSYQMAAAFRIYMNAPRNGEFESELKQCAVILKQNCAKVLNDYEIRKKMKLALYLYKYAEPLMPLVYKRVKRWR